MRISNYMNGKIMKLWIITSVILEIITMPFILMSDKLFMKIATPFFILPCALFLVILIYSFEFALYAIAFASPLFPILGYVLIEVDNEFQYFQWEVYAFIYIVFIISCIIHRNEFKLKLDFTTLYKKSNIILLGLFILSIINIFTAYYYPLTLELFMLCFLPATLYFLILSQVEIKEKDKVIKNIIFLVCLGTTISGIPDLLYFIYLLFFGDKFMRLFGPLGSNYLLSYLVMIFPIIIANYLSLKDDYKGYYKAMIIINMAVIASQFSRGIFFTLVGMFLLFFIFDRKNYKVYGAISIVVLLFVGNNVFQRPDVQDDIITINKPSETTNNHSGIPKPSGNGSTTEGSNLNDAGVIEQSKNSILHQSSSRSPIWGAAINITKDYPIFGVGNGNFKYFYPKYSDTVKAYGDAHNLVLTATSEMGIIFASLYILYILILLFSSFYDYLRTNKNLKVKYLGVFVGISGLIVFGCVTGFSLQNSREVHSYVPTFILIFMIFYYKNIKTIEG